MDPHVYQVEKGQGCVIDYCSFHLPINAVLLGKACTATAVAEMYKWPHLPLLICKFLYDQLHQESLPSDADLPGFHEKIHVHRSVIATFHTPSDLSGVGGMWCEWIWAVPTWCDGPRRDDCVFAVTNKSLKGMHGLDIAHIRLFLSISYHGTTYPCALVHWYSRVGDEPDEKTGMWIMQPDYHDDETPFEGIIHIDCIMWAAHLIGVYGPTPIPWHWTLHDSLDSFGSYYVNKYIDHHTFETTFWPAKEFTSWLWLLGT